ncbi:hypothetical protein [Bradyrhizobium quebecense]|uniref:Uncharacterized protein n=2 Tax=Bradyrhizobium quebecense TaxID=2748629 RepID=A0ABS3M8X0_9BRAD|nr:hypothetical protein [Bradyrhizobium quebecense]UGY03264.1 hypothetical protein J4P68_0000330 [Bradyrhizobium quebecense]
MTLPSTARATAAAVHQPKIGTVMSAALTPYRLAEQFSICTALDIERETKQLLTPANKALVRAAVASPPTTFDQATFNLWSAASDLIEKLPTTVQIEAATIEIATAISTAPTERQIQYLIGAMLDGLGIVASDANDGYIGALTYTLSELEPSADERQHATDVPCHIPVAALARTVKHLWQSYGETYGRPPPISQIRDHCATGRYKLIVMRDNIGRIAHQRRVLQYVVAVTERMPGPPGDDW